MNKKLKIKLTESRIFKLSQILLVCSVVFALFSVYQLSKTPYSSLYVLLLSNFLFFSFGIIFYQKVNIFSEFKRPIFINNSANHKILKIIFFLNIILILIILNQSVYIKGTFYYMALATLATILLIQILIKPNNIKDNYFILFFQIIPIALISVGSSYLINPYMIGPDSPWHFHFIQQIVDSGIISTKAAHYYYYPFYHIIQAINAILLNNLSTYTFEFLNLIVFTICVPIVYLIGKELFNDKVGLISASLFTILSSSLYLGILNTGKIGGTMLFLLCFYFIIKKKKRNSAYYSILLLLSFIGVILWHPEISLALLIILGSDVGSQFLIEKRIDFVSFALFLVLFISYLTYVNIQLFTTVAQSIFIDPKSPSMIKKIPAKGSSLIILVQYLWAYIGIAAPVFFISFIGLNWLSRLDKIKTLILCCLCGFVIFAALSVLSGNFGLNPERNLLYYSILTVFIFSYGIYEIFNSRQKNLLPLLAVFIFIFTLASTSSYYTGDGNYFFNDQIPKQTIFTTKSNLETYYFLEKTSNGSNISSDYESIRYLSDPIRGFYNLPNREIYYIDSNKNSTNSSYFLINKPNLLRLNWENTENGKNISKLISEINLLYNNGNITIYN